jgi:hypothetical protein
MRPRSKYLVVGLLLCLVVIALLLSSRLGGEHKLPFNSDAFVSVSQIAVLPARPSVAQRVEHLLLVTEEHFFNHTPRAVSLSAQPVSKWGVQSLLHLGAAYAGTRYLVSKDPAAGTVSFGTTGTMNGPQFIFAVEDTLSRSNVTWLDASKVMRTEPLALLRFPEAKTVVVLPKSDVTNFLRTNGIDPHRFDQAAK